MIISYSRLSRDDEKTKYVSIENQKRIINRYAQEYNMVIDKSFEDDGYSGYTMDRPSFNEIKHLVDENLVDIIIAKDLSRIGRHNANVLLFLERLRVHNVRIILIDDNYDSAYDDDDMIGIKTWFNERYVKDGSKKVRNALKIMQEQANLIIKVPYGYYKDPFVKNKYYVDPEISLYVKKIFNLYADGNGYKKTAKILTKEKVPTPSMIAHQNKIKKGLASNIQVATEWDPHMVRSILSNDFYIGTLRTRKTVRKTINGPQKRLKEDEHYVFEDAHEALVSKELFYFVQDINLKRNEGAYKGERKYNNPFGGLLYCGDCGSTLTILHYNDSGAESYACRAYRNKGKDFCSAHSINRKELNMIVKDYLIICRNILCDMVESLDSILLNQVKKLNGQENRLKVLNQNIEIAKNELRAIMEQKIKEMAANPDMKDIISEMYNKIQSDKMTAIEIMQTQIKEYENIDKNKSDIKNNFKSAIEVFDSILKAEELTSRQLNIIIDKIKIYESNIVEVVLKGDLKHIFKDNIVLRMSKEDKIKKIVIDYINSVSSFGIVKLMKEIHKTDSFSYEKTYALIQEFVKRGYVTQLKKRYETDHPPFVCAVSKDEMLKGFNMQPDIDYAQLVGVKKCTEGGLTNRYTYLSTDFETIVRISTWIQRYM